MAKGTFGERLKRERELREVTVKEIASAMVSIPASDAEQNLFVNSSLASAAEKSLALDLSVAASVATRVKIAADGLVVYDAELPAGQNSHFSANDKFAVTAADFSAL